MIDIQVHILYDSRPQPDKLPALLSELRRQGIEPTKIWEPVPARTIVESINLSFKQIVRYAKDKGLPEIVIIEDDLMFTCEGAWDYYINNKPEFFDVYIGGNYLINNPESYCAPHYKLDEYVGNQLIIVHNRYYDTFLGLPDNKHIDIVQKGKGEFYACFPMVALQRPGYSSNTMQIVNYNKELKPEWLFNGIVCNIR